MKAFCVLSTKVKFLSARGYSTTARCGGALPPTLCLALKAYKEQGCTAPKPTVVYGWISSIRRQKKRAFIQINDGSLLKDVQVVCCNGEQASPGSSQKLSTKSLCIGCSLRIDGHFEPHPSGDPLKEPDFVASSLSVLGHCSSGYPLQKTAYSLGYLRSLWNFRLRTRRLAAISRVSSQTMLVFHKVFSQHHFIHINTPIITGQDCEGAGNLFSVLQDSLTSSSTGTPEPFFNGKPAFLTVSGQLHLEIACAALARVYKFGPSFRAENSHTQRHLAEFWMFEAEIAFISSLFSLMDFIELCLKSVLRGVLETCSSELEFLSSFPNEADESSSTGSNGSSVLDSHPSYIETLKNTFLDRPFHRLSYKDAVVALKSIQSSAAFVNPILDDDVLHDEHEQYLASVICKGPVFICNYPAFKRPFYMKRSAIETGVPTVENVDLIFPTFGEIVGGSLREESTPALKANMEASGINLESLQWYAQLREFGGVPHAGFGVGFERFVQFLTRTSNIKDVCIAPRQKGLLVY